MTLQNEKPSNEHLKQQKRNRQIYHQKLAKGCYGLFKRKKYFNWVIISTNNVFSVLHSAHVIAQRLL